MEYQRVALLGDDNKFAGWRIQLLYNIKDKSYYIKCKGVYISYTSFLLWKKDIRKDIIGYNKEGVSCKINSRNNFISVACLKDHISITKKIEINLKKTIKWHQKQQQKQ